MTKFEVFFAFFLLFSTFAGFCGCGADENEVSMTEKTRIYRVHIADDVAGVTESQAVASLDTIVAKLTDLFGFTPEHEIEIDIVKALPDGDMNRAQTTATTRHIIDSHYLVKLEIDFPKFMWQHIPVRYHEMTHAFTAGYQLPVWFKEGLAVWVEQDIAGGVEHPAVDIFKPRLTSDSKNAILGWNEQKDSLDTVLFYYSYAYSLFHYINKEYPNVFVQMFKLMEADELDKHGAEMTTADVKRYLEKASGADFSELWNKIHFVTAPVKQVSRESIDNYGPEGLYRS